MTRAFALFAALYALAAAPDASAQSCTKYQSIQQFIQFNDVIFKGKVVSSKTQYGTTTTQFQTVEKWKGEPPATVAVTHSAPPAFGGIAFKPGETVLVIAQGMVDDLGTTSCTLAAYPEAQVREALGK